MMKKILIIAAAAMTAALATPALSSGDDVKCINSTGQWMTEDAAKAKATELGYDVRRVKREDGCYELYAIDKKGARVEIYLNPSTGEVVKTKVKS